MIVCSFARLFVRSFVCLADVAELLFVVSCASLLVCFCVLCPCLLAWDDVLRRLRICLFAGLFARLLVWLVACWLFYANVRLFG